MIHVSPPSGRRVRSAEASRVASAVVAQGRLLDTVARTGRLRGTVLDLAGRLDLDAADLAQATDELAAVRWVTVTTAPGDVLVIEMCDEVVIPQT